MVHSVAAGLLLLLAVMWILLLKNRLWQHWLQARYGSALSTVSRDLDLRVRAGWRPSLEAVGQWGDVRLRIAWTGGAGPHRLRVRVRRAMSCRRWVGRPDTPPDEVVDRVRELAASLDPT